MNNIMQLVKDFEGIIGAVLGSVSTLMATEYLRKKGNLKSYLMKFEGFYYTNDKGIIRVVNKEEDNILNYSFNYIIQIYNKSDTPKIMRDFKVIFIKDKKVVYSIVPDDVATQRYASKSYMIDETEVYNVMSREIQVLKHSGSVSEEALDLIEGSTKVELLYYDEKDKKRRVMLYKGVVGKNNYQPQSK